jgi:peptidoglycan-associated lipoprotein
MKKNLIIATLVVFACSSVFLLSSCAKKQVVGEEKVVTAAPKKEAPKKVVVKVEEEKPAEVAKEVKEEEKKAIKKAEEAKIEKPKEVEIAKKKVAEEKAVEEKVIEEKVVEEKAREEKVWEDRRGIRFEAEPVYFDFDKSFIRSEYRPVLREKAGFLKDNPNVGTRIEGNCDERGSNEYNLALGERRAENAKNFLLSLGISPDRIETISYGEERPLAVGHGEDSWAQNRRDDFVIMKK